MDKLRTKENLDLDDNLSEVSAVIVENTYFVKSGIDAEINANTNAEDFTYNFQGADLIEDEFGQGK